MAESCIKFLLLMTVLFSNSEQTCREESTPDVEFTFPELYLPRRTVQLRVINSTIVCTNVSLHSFNYQFERKNYEQFLRIANSTIPQLPPFTFSDCKPVTKLFLNEIGIRQVFPGAFTGLPVLKELHLQDNSITELSNRVFNSLNRLKILNLSNNKIEKFQKAVFMEVTRLEELYLEGNNLSSIEDGSFETLSNLKILNLTGNPLIYLGKKFPNLGRFILRGTPLTDLGENLRNLTIKQLDVASNRITSINFGNFPKSEEIDLSGNNIVAVNNCSRLVSEVLRLENNEIKVIDGTFSGLIEIFLGHNQLGNLTHFDFNNSADLRLLDFSNNNISRIGKTLFRRLFSLQTLLLQDNEILKLEVGLFHDLSNLRVLNLSNNILEEFQYGIFDNLKVLEVLDISSNRLVDLPQFAFHSLSNLRVLNFGDNEISSVKEMFLKRYLPLLVNVSLDRNPWDCQDLAMLSHNLNLMGVKIRRGSDLDVENVRGVACQNLKIIDNKTEVDMVAKTMEEAVAKSRMARFFNKDFETSKFFKFFKKYEKDGFDEKHVEKLTRVEDDSQAYVAKVFVSGVVVQVVVFGLILFVMCLIFKYFKASKIQEKRRSFALSDISYF